MSFVHSLSHPLIASAFFAFYLSAQILLTGWAWSWLYPLESPAVSTWKSIAQQLFRLILCGFPLACLRVMTLGLAGHYTPGLDGLSLFLLALIGWSIQKRFIPNNPLPFQTRQMRYLLILPVVLTIIYLIPTRSEWLAGGWDPGVYMNEGAAVERTGSFLLEDDVFQQHLSPDEQNVFSRRSLNRIERFPGILIDSERPAIRFELHRLMPSTLALFFRSGGITSASQANRIIGLFTILGLIALLLKHSTSVHALLAGLFMLCNPLWLYHAHIPLSEMLQLLFIIGIGHLMSRSDQRRGPCLMLGLLLACGILNRFSFVPFAALFLCALAYHDLERTDRHHVVKEHLVLLLFGLSAMGINLWVAYDSFLGWAAKDNILHIGMMAVALSWGLLFLGSLAAIRPTIVQRPRWLTLPAAVIACIGLVVYWRIGQQNLLSKDLDNVYRVVTYSGWPIVLTAMAGGLIVVARKAPRWPITLTCFTLFLAGISLAMLKEKNIVDLFPWALRRYHPYLVPLTSILAAAPAAYLWTHTPLTSSPRRLLALVAVALPLGLSGSTIFSAATRIEYHGLSAIYQDVAAQIDENDVVVVDSPKWGTPLLLYAGKTILNGKYFWDKRATEDFAIALKGLERLHHEGYRIRFLSTTEKGLSIYPAAIDPVHLDWTSPSYSYQVMIHHKKMESFRTKPETRTIRLYTWTP